MGVVSKAEPNVAPFSIQRSLGRVHRVNNVQTSRLIRPQVHEPGSTDFTWSSLEVGLDLKS